MIWFTSDTHFGHANVIGFSHRPWASVEAMDDALVANINACVMPMDQLYVLGDFSYRIPKEQAAELRKRIRCRRVHLVPGNHDKDWSQPDFGDAFVVDPPIAVLNEDGVKLVLSHYPIEEWQGRNHGSIHLHGHIHTVGSEYNELNRMQGILRYDVGVDANRYRPVSLDQILAWFEGVECARGDWRQWVVSTDNREAGAYVEGLLSEDSQD